MNLLQTILKKVKVRICPHCFSPDTHYSFWNRGYNHFCKQAYADMGIYCNNCRKVTFDKSLEEHKKGLPEWCTPHC